LQLFSVSSDNSKSLAQAFDSARMNRWRYRTLRLTENLHAASVVISITTIVTEPTSTSKTAGVTTREATTLTCSESAESIFLEAVTGREANVGAATAPAFV
jgi:hypothetical protein